METTAISAPLVEKRLSQCPCGDLEATKAARVWLFQRPQRNPKPSRYRPVWTPDFWKTSSL